MRTSVRCIRKPAGLCAGKPNRKRRSINALARDYRVTPEQIRQNENDSNIFAKNCRLTREIRVFKEEGRVMTTEQQRRLQNALANAMKRFWNFWLGSPYAGFQAAQQQRMEAGPHPTDTVLHEYVFGWADARCRGHPRTSELLPHLCQEVLRFRQFEEQRRQETQAWITDAAQTAVASPPNTVGVVYPRTFFRSQRDDSGSGSRLSSRACEYAPAKLLVLAPAGNGMTPEFC